MTGNDRHPPTFTDDERRKTIKLKPIGIYRNAKRKTSFGKASDYGNDKYDGVELRVDGNKRPVIIMHSKDTAPLRWKVVYGFSTVFFRSFADAVEFCNSRGFRLVKEQEE